MQVSVEKSEGLERRVKVELPAELFEQAVERRLKNLAGRVKIPGFRPGKVPMKIVRQQYGVQAKQEAIDEAVQSSLYEAITSEDLRPAGAPSVEVLPLEEGKGPTYTATFEVYPEITIADMSSVSIEKQTAEVTEADVDKVIDRLRAQRTEFVDVDRAAKEADQVTIDFVGKKDGVPFAGGEGKGVPLVMGAGRFIADFEKNLEGARAGEEKTFDAAFPEDYANKELAGQTVQFDVTVQKVSEPKLPEIDEDFVKSFGVTEGTEEALRAQVRKNMERELKVAIRMATKNQVMDALLAQHNIDLPRAMVDNEIQQLAAQMHEELKRQGVPVPDNAPVQEELYREQAERRVALGLIMSELVAKEQLAPAPEAVRALVEEIAEPYEKPEEMINWYYEDKNRLAEIEAVALEQAVVDWVLDKANVTEKQASFEDLVNQSAAG
ncbi:MAG: trigger factor [Granulosicoccaceae bacterium]|jgi:trigger factor